MRAEQEADYEWPITAATLLAALAAEREQVQADHLADLLRRAS